MNRTDGHDVTEILLNVALNTIKPTNQPKPVSKNHCSDTKSMNINKP
jgi:hypothetical protein